MLKYVLNLVDRPVNNDSGAPCLFGGGYYVADYVIMWLKSVQSYDFFLSCMVWMLKINAYV